jgi:hypothetical protein
MNLLRKAFVPLAGVAVIALVISMAGPRAVHAVVSTLVSVANTVPVVVAPTAPQLYESNCTGAFFGGAEAKCEFQAVPAGNTLFIDSVSILLNSVESGLSPQWTALETFNTGASYPFGQAYVGGGSSTVSLYVPLTKQAFSFGQNFVGTISDANVWTANSPGPKCDVLLDGSSTNGILTCTVMGHLAPIGSTPPS